MSSSFLMSLERNLSLKLVKVTSPGYFRSSKFSSDTSCSSASEEANEWAAGSDCKRTAGRRGCRGAVDVIVPGEVDVMVHPSSELLQLWQHS